VYIFHYHTRSVQIRSVHDVLIGLCSIQGLLVLILLRVGYKNRVKNTISNIIYTFLTFIELRILCLCHRNFSFALQKPVILHSCRSQKQRERSLLIPSLRPSMLTFSCSMSLRDRQWSMLQDRNPWQISLLPRYVQIFRHSPVFYKIALVWDEEAQ
jgi:hypothetical protein